MKIDDKAVMFKQVKKKRLFAFALPDDTDATQLFARHADKPYSLFFDSNRESHPLNRYSYLCVDPFETIESRDGSIFINNADNSYKYKTDPFQVVKERLNLYGHDLSSDKNLPRFQGGAAGFFGYDLCRQIEKLPSTSKKNDGIPDMCIGLYDCIAAFDHKVKKAWIIVHAENEKSAHDRKKLFDTVTTICPDSIELEWKTETENEKYCQKIQKVIDYIYAGDIFQANLSRRFTAGISEKFNAYRHYCHLRKVNAAPYSNFMNFGTVKISGSSPERFLSVRSKKVETSPIKGTLSSDQPAKNLSNNEKDRAENAMIVDLMRNDLSKVCEDHSVEVQSLFAIETFEGLHHMVSTVTGQLRADKTSLDLLRACFPGGSVTGAPKIRAMEIIEELEPDQRGPYCGAMGMISWNGDMETNIAIRTLVYNHNTVSLQTGGGITALSIPEQELNETLVKAQKLFSSFTDTPLKEDKA